MGAGPAGLAAAEVIAAAGVSVVVHERMPNPARKFLLAGRGGLNLTHSEPLEQFLARYGEARDWLEPAVTAFPPEALRAWCEELGVATFVGTSGRVFPKAMKASPLLRAWLRRLEGMGVELKTRSRWAGWDGDALVFETAEGRVTERVDAVVFALGGGSWARLGSDGGWVGAFAARGAEIAPLKASNSGFLTGWSEVFRTKFAGEPIKSARFAHEGRETRGEAVVTAGGIEGGAIYALSASLREAILGQGHADLEIDFQPQMTVEALAKKLGGEKGVSTANRLRRAGLSPAAAGLMREGGALPADAVALARLAKRCVIRLTGVAAMERAISTAGGIRFESLNTDFSLKSDPRTFVVGEMLDWEAPTGGYLLQACFATGRAAGHGVLARLRTSPAQ